MTKYRIVRVWEVEDVGEAEALLETEHRETDCSAPAETVVLADGDEDALVIRPPPRAGEERAE